MMTIWTAIVSGEKETESIYIYSVLLFTSIINIYIPVSLYKVCADIFDINNNGQKNSSGTAVMITTVY